jgi:hypothetical protein
MAEVPQAPESSPLVRYGFAAVFIAACLYDLKVGVRVAGVFMLGQSIYQTILGRVPLENQWKETTGYLKGPAAIALIAGIAALSMILIFAPNTVIRLLAMTQ